MNIIINYFKAAGASSERKIEVFGPHVKGIIHGYDMNFLFLRTNQLSPFKTWRGQQIGSTDKLSLSLESFMGRTDASS